MANYRDQEETRQVKLLQADVFSGDCGNGDYGGIPRPFVLDNPQLNLWEGVRENALRYFKKNRIQWWNPSADCSQPTGHLLSSQIACLNHLFFIRHREDYATKFLLSHDPEIERAVIFDNGNYDDGYVEFEFIGSRDNPIPVYLNEVKEYAAVRGTQCTSIDAALLGLTKSGEKRLFLFEWKYTEENKDQNNYDKNPKRRERYDHLIRDMACFCNWSDIKALYRGGFYQLMRQTLFGRLAVEKKIYDVSSYKHFLAIPAANTDYREPSWLTNTIENEWKKYLKEPNTFMCITPQKLLCPVIRMSGTDKIANYLQKRYCN